MYGYSPENGDTYQKMLAIKYINQRTISIPFELDYPKCDYNILASFLVLLSCPLWSW